MNNPFASIEQAIAAIKAGRMIMLLDDENRENEGDLVIAAEHASPEAINFMSQFGRGLICLSMSHELIDQLQLPMMVNNNRSPYGTAFTVSIEAANGVSTGISAKDRARTIQVAVNPSSGPNDIISPGHVFPLRAVPGGVLRRQGQTEGSVDLARLSGHRPAAVICEILNEDGTMSRRDQLAMFSRKHDIPMVTISDLIAFRIRHENLVNPEASSVIPLHDHGMFNMTVFRNQLDDFEHFSLAKIIPGNNKVPLVRIHSECITGDVFGSCKCDCGEQLQHSLKKIGEEGGVFIYLRQEGRGIGLSNKLKAYALQEQGYDTVEANVELGLAIDCRDYAVAFQILKYMGISVLRLLTNNPQKLQTLEKYGLTVSERIPLVIKASTDNRDYLKTKQLKLGHWINID